MAAGQENCYACGQHVHARGYRHDRRANPVVLIAAGLMVVAVLGVLFFIRTNTARKQAAQAAEEEAGRAQDSARVAGRKWTDALKAAEKDATWQAINADLDLVESRFQSVCTRVAASPTPQQKSIIDRAEAEVTQLRHSAVEIVSLPDDERQALRDSIQAGMDRVEDLTRELGSTE